MSFKKELIRILNGIADLLEFNGENKFKVSAFKNSANTIRRLEGDLEQMIIDESIKSVKGIGKGIQKVIYEYAETGISTDYESLKADIPQGVIDLFSIRGIGAKKVRMLYEELSIESIDSLEHACLNNNVAQLKGFGEKIQDKILVEIKLIKRSSGYMLLNKALAMGAEYVEVLQSRPYVKRVEFTGQLRRKLEIIDRIEVILAIKDYKDNYKKLSKLYRIKELSEFNSYYKLVISIENGSDVNLYVTDPLSFNTIWYLTTGSDEYLANSDSFDDSIKASSEEEVAQKIGLEYIMPEMREGAFIDAPKELKKNTRLSLNDFHGFLHFHTTKSDGQNTLDDMTAGALKSGFKYLAVCDHSKSAFYANGLTEERILLQKNEIKEISSRYNIEVFHGIESDILRDGSLDYENDFMENFEFVVASIHSIFNLTEDEMTSRMIRAIENENTDVIAHPTGRLLLSRAPYKVNIKKIIDACVLNDVAIEINANPHRLDLDWRNLFYAREKGCKFSINPDAHSVEGIMDSEYGIMIARKGGVQPEEVINCYDIESFKKYINRKIKRIN